MDSLKDLLSNKNLDEPSEISALREYCIEIFNFEPKISIKNNCLWLIVPSGIIAGELRMRLPEINKRCGLTRKLVIRIG